MVVGRVLRVTGCPSCRVSILWSFASLYGPPIQTPYLGARFRYPPSASRVRFSSSALREDDSQRNSDKLHGHNAGAEDTDVFEEVPKSHGGSLEVSTVPWYLQVDAPQKAPRPLSERQRIPDLPESPPPILQPLLQQLSVDLGLDSLSLFDLRKLNPPSAFGANLMMVIGTARSEKHLHVSADRFCRWLRSAYKLRPDADGLLGRNELKLKLRRKLRRSKLLGSEAEDNGDDGVRTGWICIDVGTVESSKPVPDEGLEATDFVGFGRRTDGVRMVIQMLTEEKREEINLEKLWGDILKRGTQQEIEETTVRDSENPPSSTLSGTAKKMGNTLPHTPSQSRGFHTSVFHPSAQPQAELIEEASHLSNEVLPSVIGFKSFDMDDIRLFVMRSIAAGNFESIETDLLRYSKDIPELQDERWRPYLLKELIAYLESIPRDAAIINLGNGPNDYNSTPFLANFYKTLSEFPSGAEGDAVICLYCYAMEIGHARYKLHDLVALFTELQQSAVAISSKSYLRLLQCVVSVRDSHNHDHPPRAATDAAVKILQAMHDQGHKVLTEEIFLILAEAAASELREPIDPSYLLPPSSNTFDLPSLPRTALQDQIHAAMTAVDIPFFQEATQMRLLDLYSRQQHWDEFFHIFRMAARHGKPRSHLMYAFMFSRVAETRNQKGCISVLRTWIHEMELEDSMVLLKGDVAKTVVACLRVADPYVEEDAARDPPGKGEWVSLWRRCMDGLEY